MPMLIGTSGWQYRDWRGGLYPDGVPQRLWLGHYAARYQTVGNNNSFYRLPPRETFAAWRERTPDEFVMAVKASRYLTHVRRLRDPAEPVARLLGAAAGLGPKLGPVLLQLPPTLKADPGTLDTCLKEFRKAAVALASTGSGSRWSRATRPGGPLTSSIAPKGEDSSRDLWSRIYHASDMISIRSWASLKGASQSSEFRGDRVSDTASRLEWLEEEPGAGCVERSFVLSRRSGLVPGVLWSPETTTAPPTVLLFHGGSGHKRSERHLRMGRRLAAAGLAVLAIDGPYRGGRVPSPMAPAVYQQLIVDEGIERVTGRMTADWLETVSALGAGGLVDGANVSVFGMSMGARFGLPVAAALGSRLRCAVLGKFGFRQTGLLHPGLCAPGLIAAAARCVSAPVLYHVQWNDAIFPRDGQFELFDALASADKHLIARSGVHAETHPDDEASWQEFIRTKAPGARRR
jgi:dienelactone hydrolase